MTGPSTVHGQLLRSGDVIEDMREGSIIEQHWQHLFTLVAIRAKQKPS